MVKPPPQSSFRALSSPQKVPLLQQSSKYYFSYYYYYYFLFINIFIYLYFFLAVLVLRFCARAFSSCGKQGPLFIAMRGPFTVAASLVAEHRLQTRRLSSCGSRAQLLCGMWDLPRPGLEPVSPALAGGLSTTAPPGKPPIILKYFSDLSQPGRVGPQIIEHCLENKISVL